MSQPLDEAAAGPAISAIRDAPKDRPFVVAQLGQSLDGRIATPTGESRWINKFEALRHVHRIRASVDAVVVGVGTVVADDPMLNVRHVAGLNPVRVVIDPNGRVPADAKCMHGGDSVRRLVVRGVDMPAPSGVEVVRVALSDGRLRPQAIVAALWAKGIRSMLVEGGAQTVSGFIDDRAVDRLHVLVAPVILGSGKPGLALSPIARLSEALRPRAAVHVLGDGDVLFDCDMRQLQPET